MADRRKLTNAALALPVFGAALVIPPLINVFDVPILLFGIPLEVVYLFAVWIGLIVTTAFLSRKMVQAENDVRNSELVLHIDGNDD